MVVVVVARSRRVPEVTSVCRAFSSANTGPHTPPGPHRSGTRCTRTDDEGGGGDGEEDDDDGDEEEEGGDAVAAVVVVGAAPSTPGTPVTLMALAAYSTECLSFARRVGGDIDRD